MSDDYYDLLGVGRGASDDEIKKAYRQLARELHPDANHGDREAEERFKQVTVAYETLRDPERRRRYDQFGPDAARMGAGGDPFGGSGIGDIFDAFFSGGGFGGGGGFGTRRSGPRRGSDLEVLMELGFEEAVFGAQREVTVRAPVVCETCEGSGAKQGTYPATCSGCQGTGEVRRVRQSILGQVVTASPCPRCGGEGREVTHPCPDCRGEGRRTEERSYTVDVPAGVDDGSQLRLTGRGAAGPRGGINGDLYVHVRVAPHERFAREGINLRAALHLPVTQAALGATVDFETLDGTESLVIPAGTQTGKVFTLRNQGVPRVDGRGRGDLLVTVVVDTPTGITAEEEDLLRKLAEVRGDEVAAPEEGFLSRLRSAFK